MQLIDTHCHLYSKKFDHDRTEMVQRAIAAGITEMYLPNIDEASIEGMLALEAEFPENCFAMMGLHPCHVTADVEKELKVVEDWLAKRPFIAVGETGLDLYWDKTFFPQQQTAFRRQLQWAKELQIPIVIHARESIDECIELVTEAQDGNLTGVFHCFTGSVEQAQKIVDLNFMMGLGGVLTYKKGGLEPIVEGIDIQHFVVETDAPYLSPTPFRGKRNESLYVQYVADKMAAILDMPVADVCAKTTANAQRLFTKSSVLAS